MPKSSDEAASPSKIPYLDGLRGYSILSVVISHWLLSVNVPRWLIPAKLLFGNGVLGVNIFFAISGFLITTLLLRDHLLQTIAQQGEDVDWSAIAHAIKKNAGL